MMRKRVAAVILALTTALVLVPGMANASPARGHLCIRTHHIQIGYCP
jgi:hypothetical protein